MIEIKEECTRFKTSQRLADQARTIIKWDQLSDFEILQMHQQINRESGEQNPNIKTKMVNTEKQGHSNQIEILSYSN